MANNENRISTSSEVRKKQIALFAIVLSVIAVFVIGFFLMGNGPAPTADNHGKLSEKTPVYDVTQAVDDKSYWVFESERKMAEQSEKQTQLLKQIEEIKSSLNQPPDHSEDKHDKDEEIFELRHKIAQLEAQIEEKNSTDRWDQENSKEQGNHKSNLSATATSQYLPGSDYYGEQVSTTMNMPMQAMGVGGIFSETIALEENPEDKMLHIDNYIPAATYVGARLLGGADVSVGVSAQSDPQPLTLRLTDNGSLPNHMKSHLRDCRIIVAAHGVLSSERVQMRLEKLSCVEPDGRPIETDIEGYVVGKDGKNGVRGRMVIRDGEMLKRSFVGGFLSGLGNATAQAFGSTSISPLGSINTVQGADVVKSASAQGVGNAFELMARYNIQRAEQYQPVIQMSAGQEVHVVFTRGAKLGEKRQKKREETQSMQKHNTIFGDQ